jgi:hypothetical protein
VSDVRRRALRIIGRLQAGTRRRPNPPALETTSVAWSENNRTGATPHDPPRTDPETMARDGAR